PALFECSYSRSGNRTGRCVVQRRPLRVSPGDERGQHTPQLVDQARPSKRRAPLEQRIELDVAPTNRFSVLVDAVDQVRTARVVVIQFGEPVVETGGVVSLQILAQVDHRQLVDEGSEILKDAHATRGGTSV